MSKLYACIISNSAKADKEELLSVARQFSYDIEMLDDGVLFDIGGLERLIGKPDQIAKKILAELKQTNTPGSVAVAETVDTAALLARCTSPHVSKGDSDTSGVSPSLTVGLVQTEMFEHLPLTYLPIERDTLNVFSELGINKVQDLLAIPRDDLVGRYGREFTNVIDKIEQKSASFIVPNVKESQVSWRFDLDHAVDDFEQLIFIVNHGLDNLLGQVDHHGMSTEQLDIAFQLCRSPHLAGTPPEHLRAGWQSKGVTSNTETKTYEIKTSFPTLEKTFWLKLINLRVSLDPPEAAILSVGVVAHFTKPRPSQRGLYAVSRPEPESLLLTANKLKKLVGEDNVGTPVLLNQRLSKPFALDADAMPAGKESFSLTRETSDLSEIQNPKSKIQNPVIAFSYFNPPIRAEVLVREGRLVFIKTHDFSGHVTEYSGVWKANSKWWDKSWKTQEWDVEVENNGVYRLCKVDKEWFLAGEYD